MGDIVTHLERLCASLRAVVLPGMGVRAARAHAGVAVGGDVTFGIDEQAERHLADYMARHLPRWAYYSEDGGLSGAADPEMILIVDPIDGTRPAAAGFEMACVSVAAVPPSSAPTMGDVVAGVIQEIKSGDVFTAEKGEGFSMRHADGTGSPFSPSGIVDIESLFWTIGFRGRPAVILARALEELIDASSVGGAMFDIGSAAYGITRILTGQLDAHVDVGPEIIAAHPWTEAEFRRVGRGNVLCNSPYDVAAAHVLCREAGIPMTGARGEALDDRLVLGSDAGYQIACIASANAALQHELVALVGRGIDGLESQVR